MSEIKQYDTEVRLEAVMGTNHYGVHIHAMTTEDLHSKSGIAVELAWRDLRIEQLIAQLEAAQKERDEFRLAFQQNEQAKQELFAQKDLLITANLNISRRAGKAEAELSAANEKLSKPVVLPRMHVGFDGVSTNAGDSVRNKAINDCAESIRTAGFTVEGEPAPVKYIVILQRAWCNDSGSGIDYHSDLVEFDNRDKAIKHGFKLQDSDDFNIGVLTNGILTSFDWMAKPLAATAAALAQIAENIGVAGFAVEGE